MNPRPHSQTPAPSDRRAHMRLEIQLPVECRPAGERASDVIRTVTKNVSTGGLYLELDAPDFQCGDRLQVDLTVPAAEGVSSYEGCATCPAEVQRVSPLGCRSEKVAPEGGLQRYGVAMRFLGRLRITY